MKTFKYCLEVVKPEWFVQVDNGMLNHPSWDNAEALPTERQAQQIINLKKMMVIAEAVGMDEIFTFRIISELMDEGEIKTWHGGAIEDFICICQDPDGDGDESKNLFNPFKPEKP